MVGDGSHQWGVMNHHYRILDDNGDRDDSV